MLSQPEQEEKKEIFFTIGFDKRVISSDTQGVKTPIEESALTSPSETMAPPPSRRSFDDQSELLSQVRIHDENPQPFNIALDLWCEEAEIFRAQYTSLREILRMLEPHPILSRLSVNYSILRRRTQGHLPQLPLRRSLISLILEKQTTRREKSKRARVRKEVTEYLYFFDSSNLFKRILLSQLVQSMHVGFGEFRTNPVELWQSQCWTGSVRTTSGQYARYRNQTPIFPSDWVLYRKDDTEETEHLGRVVGIGRDYRDSTAMETRGIVVVKIQHAMRPQEIPQSFHELRYFQRHEAVLLSTFSFVTETLISYHYPYVTMDYTLDEDQSRIPRVLPQSDVNHFPYLVRCFITATGLFHSLCYSFSLRAELELQEYGRNYFCDEFNCVKGIRCISLPLLLFLDGFGLYRNSYRSLMAVYFQLASLFFHERMRRANVFPLTLRSHGSNLNEIIDALSDLRRFDREVWLDLSQPTRVCAFTLCFLEDMSQQQINAGFKSQNATKGCRFCTIDAHVRGNLDFDIIRQNRFHNVTVAQRQKMASLSTKIKREKFASDLEFSVEQSSLFNISPALDIITTRLSDFAHSEYGDICKMFHTLLLEIILTIAGAKSYAIAIRS